MIGTVDRFFSDKGFGFLRSPELTNDLFVHIKDVIADHFGAVSGRRELLSGDILEFEIIDTAKGRRAVCATVIEPALHEDADGTQVGGR